MLGTLDPRLTAVVVTVAVSALAAIGFPAVGEVPGALQVTEEQMGSVDGLVEASPTAPDACAPHPPILITEEQGEQGFIRDREPVTGRPIYRPGSGVVAGNGSADDPYVIAGWCIESGDDGRPIGITLKGTTAHVVVSNTVIVNDGGEPLESSSVLTNGIQIDGAENVTVTETEIRGVRYSGIDIFSGQRIEIRESVVHKARRGIFSFDTASLNVRGNEITDSGLSGLFASRSPDAEIIGNTFNGSGRADIELDESKHATLRDNELSRGVHLEGHRRAHHQHDIDRSNRVDGDPVVYLQGEEPEPDGRFGQLLLVGTDAARIQNVTVTGAAPGIQVAFSDGVVVSGATVRDHGIAGIRLTHTQNARVVNATILDGEGEGTNGDGIMVFESQGARVEGSKLHRNADDGVTAYRSSGTHVVNNTITGNGHAAFEATDARGSVFAANIARDNEEGVSYYSASGSTIENNTILNHDAPIQGEGVSVESSGSVVIANNTIRGNTDGLRLYLAGGARIVDNVIANNTDRGLQPDADTTVEGNNIYGNGESGLHVYVDGTLDVRDNWWGSTDGPSGGPDDACTNAQADGSGDSITVDWGAVCFDPWLRAPNDRAGPSLSPGS